MSHRSARFGLGLSTLAATVAVALGVSSAGTAPPPATAASGVTIDNCGVKVHVDRPPTRAVTLNQGATEMLLALGLQKQMIGTAYLDDAIAPRYREAYRSVPVLAKEYPSAETFLAARPDFAVASYASAFSAQEGVGTRADLAKLGIGTYLLPAGCAGANATAPATFGHLFAQIRQLGAIFGARGRADALVRSQEATLKRVHGTGRGVRVLWWDSETKAPFVGACCGGPALIMKTVGATNVFASAKGNWTTVDWEAALATKPDMIVLVDASWDTAKSKMAFLARDAAAQSLPAVRDKRFVVIPFSDSTPGVRMVDGVQKLAAGLRKYAPAR